eukprot:scaffold53_cov193-Pinguiococcus_pyrenoidosus.AAC.57
MVSSLVSVGVSWADSSAWGTAKRRGHHAGRDGPPEEIRAAVAAEASLCALRRAVERQLVLSFVDLDAIRKDDRVERPAAPPRAIRAVTALRQNRAAA